MGIVDNIVRLFDRSKRSEIPKAPHEPIPKPRIEFISSENLARGSEIKFKYGDRDLRLESDGTFIEDQKEGITEALGRFMAALTQASMDSAVQMVSGQTTLKINALMGKMTKTSLLKMASNELWSFGIRAVIFSEGGRERKIVL